MTEQEFHTKRLPFYLDLDTLIVKTPPTKYRDTSHAKWFSDMGITFPHTVRGYIMQPDNGEHYIMIYWNDFEIPNIGMPVIVYLFEYFPEISWIGVGCNKGKPGEVWTPKLKITRPNG